MSDESSKLITQPHNPYLLETFRAFTAEGLPVPIAVAMVQAHIAHGQMAVMDAQAKALASIADSLARIASLTDPVEAGRVLALVRAADAKREAKAQERAVAEKIDRVEKVFMGKTDAELAS